MSNPDTQSDKTVEEILHEYGLWVLNNTKHNMSQSRAIAALRDYRDKFPDADYNDVMGYIAGFQYRPANPQEPQR